MRWLPLLAPVAPRTEEWKPRGAHVRRPAARQASAAKAAAWACSTGPGRARPTAACSSARRSRAGSPAPVAAGPGRPGRR